MAQLVPVRFGDQSIQFGNGAEPTEAFAVQCGVVGIAENFSINTQSDDLMDCDDPDALSFESPYKVSVGQSIDLQIQASAANKPFFTELAYEPEATNIRHVFNRGAYDGYYEGPAILTALSWTSERRGILTGTATLSWQAQPDWVPAA
jgi:hypothetical protein